MELGADPVRAVKMGSFNAAQYFGLSDRGAVAPGYRADLLVVEDLRAFEVRQVYKDGVLRGGEGGAASAQRRPDPAPLRAGEGVSFLPHQPGAGGGFCPPGERGEPAGHPPDAP